LLLWLLFLLLLQLKSKSAFSLISCSSRSGMKISRGKKIALNVKRYAHTHTHCSVQENVKASGAMKLASTLTLTDTHTHTLTQHSHTHTRTGGSKRGREIRSRLVGNGDEFTIYALLAALLHVAAVCECFLQLFKYTAAQPTSHTGPKGL